MKVHTHVQPLSLLWNVIVTGWMVIFQSLECSCLFIHSMKKSVFKMVYSTPNRFNKNLPPDTGNSCWWLNSWAWNYRSSCFFIEVGFVEQSSQKIKYQPKLMLLVNSKHWKMKWNDLKKTADTYPQLIPRGPFTDKLLKSIGNLFVSFRKHQLDFLANFYI